MGIKRYRILLAGTLLFGLCYCSVNQYLPTHQHIEFASDHWDGVDSLYLFNGYDAYRNKCGSCHYLYKPSQYKLAEWNKILPEMKVKAKMTDEEFEPLRKYVLTLSQVEITK